MQDLYISLNSNKLRISTVDPKKGFCVCTKELTDNIVSGSKIIDTLTFTSILGQSIEEVTTQSKNRLLMNILLEPEEIKLGFITVNKTDIVDEVLLTNKIHAFFGNDNLADYYYSYQKIAPFTYQFIGVKKELLEQYLEISNNAGVALNSVSPWILMLPKYTQSTKPVIFVSKRDAKHVLALSNLNGIFFATEIDKELSFKEIETCVSKNTKNDQTGLFNTIYTLGYDAYSMSGFQTEKVELPVSDVSTDLPEGFDVHIVTNFMIDKDPSLIEEQVNMLNLLPVPAVRAKISPMVYVGPVVLLLIFVGAYFGITALNRNQKPSDGELAGNLQGNVLSETTTTGEASQSSTSSPAETKPVDLKKADLSFRVENGTGVSGLAAKTKDYLSGLGYKVVSIDTADATRKDTLISFKPNKLVYKDLLLADVKEKFPDAVIDDKNRENSEYDVLVIIGEGANF
jgi:hypothetical protein